MEIKVEVKVDQGVRVDEELEVGVKAENEDEEQQLIRIGLSWPCKQERTTRHKQRYIM